MKRPPEMSRRAFQSWLAANNFRQILAWIDDGENPGNSYGIVCYRNGKVARRATIAKIKREREKETSRRQAIVDSGIDYYALSNGLSTVMPDGTLVNNDPEGDDR